MPTSPIYIAVYIADLRMPWVKSLKAKRSIITPVTEKLKTRYPVSVARLDGLNAHHWERIGASAISHDAIWLESLLARVDAFVRSHAECEVELIDSVVEVWDLPA